MNDRLKKWPSGNAVLDDNDVGLDLSVDGSRAELPRQRCGARRRSLSQPCAGTGLDLVAQGRSLAISDGRHPSRCRTATRRDRLEAWRRAEPGIREVA